MRHARITWVLLGWTLLYSRFGGDWKVVGDFAYSSYCHHARSAYVRAEALTEIGGALATQSVDNPMRARALGRVQPRVRARYRCERL